MNKQKILELTGLSEDDFYNNYPDQQTFCVDYPDACHELNKAQNGMQQPNISYETQPSGWQIIDGQWTRPRTISAQGNALVPVRPVVDFPQNNTPTPDWQVRDGMWARGHMPPPVNKRPTMTAMSPVGTQYNFPKIPLQTNVERLTAKQTMNKVGSTGAPIVLFSTPVPMQNTIAAVTSKYTLPVQQVAVGTPPSAPPIPIPFYNTNSLVDTMKALNINSSFASRRKLALQNGITDYKGTASQNLALRDKLVSTQTFQNGGEKPPSERLTLSQAKGTIWTKKDLTPDGWALLQRDHSGAIGLSSNRLDKNGYHMAVYPDSYNKTSLRRLVMQNKPLDANAPSIKGQQVPIPPMTFPKQTGTPVYGPGNTIIGYSDDSMNFKQAYEYTGAPNNTFNLQDKVLLNNPDALKEYLSKIDNYKFQNKTYKAGGYYGMDQKFHPNNDSGTYVGGAGYYFDTGGGTTASPASAPGTSGGVDVSGVPGAGAAGAYGIRADGSFAGDLFSDVGNFDNSSDPFGGQDQSYGRERYQANPYEESNDQQQPPVYDPSQYTSEIDPSTGFIKYKKNGLAIRNIKREDPTLWNHLKDEGHGARWATGQTDFQRVGRTAGAIGQGLEAGINVAGAIGGYLNNRNKQRNMDKSAMNMGSTASMFTNPSGSSKGDYGVTGSTYGQFKPNQVSNMSFKGMYGKYGMQVPKYAVGGFEPQINILEDYKSIGPNQNTVVPFAKSYNSPLALVDNTRVASPVVPLEIRKQQPGPLDVDLALQAVSGHESGVKPGQTKVGFRTRLVGEGGKRASASGTYQITTGTLQQIYKNDKNINSAFNTFNQFKSAFDTDPKVEYAAAKSLMSDHIKNYGVYALGAWYQPTFAKRAMQGDKSVFNIVPRKDYGNKVKWGTDFKNKLNSYNKLAGTHYEIMKYGGQQQGGQVVEMDENQIQQFLAAGGQLEFLD